MQTIKTFCVENPEDIDVKLNEVLEENPGCEVTSLTCCGIRNECSTVNKIFYTVVFKHSEKLKKKKKRRKLILEDDVE